VGSGCVGVEELSHEACLMHTLPRMSGIQQNIEPMCRHWKSHENDKASIMISMAKSAIPGRGLIFNQIKKRFMVPHD